MRHLLPEPDKVHLEQRVAETEKLIQSQIVLATTEKSDTYIEIPWKAFSLGAILTTLPVLLILTFYPVWMTNGIILISLVVIFLSAAAAALLTIICPSFARLFLTRSRVYTETRQYAESFFLNRELFNTPDRMTVLILLSTFEKQVTILPDKGLNDRLASSDLQKIIASMTVLLAKNKTREAFDLALDELTRFMKSSAERSRQKDLFSNEIIEEQGV